MKRVTFANKLANLMLLIVVVHQQYTRPLKRQLIGSYASAYGAAGLVGRSASIHEPASDQEPSRLRYRPIAILQRLARPAKWHLIASVLVYAYLMAKYVLIELMGHLGVLENYQWLDCCLLGRFRFVGRTNKIANEMAIWALLVFIIIRLVYSSHLARRFRYHFIEFLWQDFEEVQRMDSLDNERQRRSRRHHHFGHNEHDQMSLFERRQLVRKLVQTDRVLVLGGGGRRSVRKCTALARDRLHPGGSTTDPYNPLFHVKRSVIGASASGQIFLRLNRTRDSWLALRRINEYLALFAVCTLFCWTLILANVIGGSIITSQGFELAYPSCVVWLREQQRHNKSFYSFIYQAPQLLTNELPLEQLPSIIPFSLGQLNQATVYDWFRVVFDLAETSVIYLEFLFFVLLTDYGVALASADINMNARAIRAVVLELIEKFEARLDGQRQRQQIKCSYGPEKWPAPPPPRLSRQHTTIGLVPTYYCTPSERLQARPMMMPWNTTDPAGGRPRPPAVRLIDDRCLKDDTIYLQALLVDHFKLIQSYNAFVSCVMLNPIGCLVTYTIIICVWMSGIKRRAIQTEFIMAESGALLMTFMTLSSAAFAGAYNRRLYPLIAKLMALDQLNCFRLHQAIEHPSSITKLRWITILKYYFPKSSFCFTLFDSTEVSWFFCLKVSPTVRPTKRSTTDQAQR
jgi:hypothetical protein